MSTRPVERPRPRSLLALASLVLLAGTSCGGPSMNPELTRARTALDASLTAWREGKRPGLIAGTDPPVQVVDNEWTNGRKLAAFEVLRETPSTADKRFVARLTYAAPPATAEVTYIVLGASPIAVFREDDYARTLNMDNNPTPKGKAPRR